MCKRLITMKTLIKQISNVLVCVMIVTLQEKVLIGTAGVFPLTDYTCCAQTILCVYEYFQFFIFSQSSSSVSEELLWKLWHHYAVWFNDNFISKYECIQIIYLGFLESLKTKVLSPTNDCLFRATETWNVTNCPPGCFPCAFTLRCFYEGVLHKLPAFEIASCGCYKLTTKYI